MATSPPASPVPGSHRPSSSIAKLNPRSSSRLSMSGTKILAGSTGAAATAGTASRASDEESRTAVRVVVRIRPPLKSTDPGYDLIPQRFQRSMVQTTSDTSLSIDSPHGRKLFVFDRVFAPDVMQDGIWDYLNESVTSFTQGYNVSLLAYGQSGAGKSYTMGTSGPSDQHDPSSMGVIPRAAAALFEKLDSTKTNSGIPSKSNRNSLSTLRTPRAYGQQNALGDRDWSLKATYVEIYNEQLRDLLVPESGSERANVAIREDTKGNIILTGLHSVDINSVEDLMNALTFGSSIRQTDATAINAKSSRSHAVFSLNLVQRKAKNPVSGAEKRFSVPIEALTGQETTITTDSKLHFVDLAGSERLKNTGAQGERAKEGISINAGLASLGKVISQLSSRQSGSHVSYRDSKLTRLLQDSLGGNAITYMIACVTPAEFHLSETLNTVQYAQRARAIQSKPRIQQVEEGDKSAVIDRLKAEVAFLREQIRSSESRGNPSPRIAPGQSDRPDRSNEREVELQNQLLDTQENYATLSQRHARLISEMAKARENSMALLEADDEDDAGERADDRLNRSNSFAQAVEQVVLEYEKTIQSLEQSLSSTRGTLSNTETSLLERESKCAYVETINTQLQARLQKLIDREANTENYLHDLENKLDGHTSGEEKNSTIIMELRKEIARVRENEASCEDYISTLEERLAEADQDSELMQREIDRLEQVVERQRSLGKLDSLLHELDNVQEVKPTEPEPKAVNGVAARRLAERSREHSRNLSLVSRHSQAEEAIPEGDEPLEADATIDTVKEEEEEEKAGDEEEEEKEEKEEPEIKAEALPSLDETTTAVEVKHEDGEVIHQEATVKERTPGDLGPPSPAQTKYVADKLETVTQELIGLRVEHESTVNEYDSLSSKYEQALHQLSELQDALDEARHSHRNNVRDSVMSETSNYDTTRPESFLSDTRSSDLKDGPRSSHSQSLSSELSSAMDSPVTAATSNGDVTSDEDDAATTKPAVSTENLKHAENEQLVAELQKFKDLAAEREAAEKELVDKYAQLETQHNEALDMVEELKTEVSRAKAVEATSPRQAPVIRRKSSQNLLSGDRAQRSFVALRNIANDNLEGNPEVMQSFEINVNSALHELQSRSERVAELENALAATKKEMETKMTIISGLTRERSSLTASPRDMSMVANLQGQLEQSEKQLVNLREANAARESALMVELDALKRSSAESTSQNVQNAAGLAQYEAKVAQLETELAQWETKHQTVRSTMDETEKEMQGKITELEAELASAKSKSQDANDVQSDEAKEAEQKQQNLIQFLRSEVDEYKAIINSNAAKVADLESSHNNARSELEAMTKAHGAATDEVTQHRELVNKLQEQITAHEEATKSHQENLAALKDAHTKELTDLKNTEQLGYQEQVEVLMSEHSEAIQRLETEAQEARDALMNVASQVAYALGVEVSIDQLADRIDSLIADQKTLAAHVSKTGELESHVAELSSINETVLKELEAAKTAMAEMLGENKVSVRSSIIDHVSVVKTKMADLEDRSKKNSRLVEELEEQLQNNFDEAQVTSNRLSTLQTERNSQLEEAVAARQKLQSDLDSVREEYNVLQSKFEEAISSNGQTQVQRSDSNSTVRKSASHASLPSPPPSVPLPPLPGNASGSPPPGSPVNGRPASKDAKNSSISQMTEDQEARIRTIEKHLYAERQLTQTLEEALNDLEKQSNKVKADADAWKRRAHDLETEVKELKDRPAATAEDNRWSVHAVEEERKKRQAAEAARRQLEERMNAINKGKKKKNSLNCF